MMLITMSKVKYFHVAIYSSPSLSDERTETSKRRVVTRGEDGSGNSGKIGNIFPDRTLVEVDKKRLDSKPLGALRCT